MPSERQVSLTKDYLAGFIDGEGCFLINEKQPDSHPHFDLRFHVAQRADNKLVLQLLQEQIGGYLSFEPPTAKQLERHAGHKPQYRLIISNRKDVLGLIKYIDEHPLICKAAEYQVWQEAAHLYYRYSPGSGGQGRVPNWLIEAMKKYKAEIERLREYDAAPQDLSIGRDDSQLELL